MAAQRPASVPPLAQRSRPVGRPEMGGTASRGARDPAQPRHAGVLEGLQSALATTFTVYRDTHLAHFNVRGPSFAQWHTMLEGQYDEQWQAVDVVAERIRALGHLVTQEALAAGPSKLPTDGQGMLGFLLGANREAAAQWERLFEACEAAGDHATADLCNQRVAAHQKHAWMLEATLDA